MNYIAVTLNHFRAMKKCAAQYDARIVLDMEDMVLAVKARGLHYHLKPRFLAHQDGRLHHTHLLTDQSSGFIGWLPYDTLQWPISTDKLAFRQLLLDHGLKVPQAWHDAHLASADFLCKRSMGSFGYAQSGPYPAGATPAHPAGDQGTVYAEQFIKGRNLKVWFWGETPFHAHLDDYPTLTADGHSSVAALIDARLQREGSTLATHPERAAILASLRYQGLNPDDTPSAGQTLWMDYRYGRLYQPAPISAVSDSRLHTLTPGLMAQVTALVDTVCPLLMQTFQAPVLFAVDGVIDASDTIWWLEMNSNPILPPDGYAPIFATLFGQVAPK